MSGNLRDIIPIAERPPEVDERAVPDDVTTELHRKRFRHNDLHFSEDEILTDQKSPEPGADPSLVDHRIEALDRAIRETPEQDRGVSWSPGFAVCAGSTH